MPYITQERRDELDSVEVWSLPKTAGELTYKVTKLVVDYLPKHLSFQDIAEAVAALECSKLELYRRIAAPYENGKRDLNGEVYP